MVEIERSPAHGIVGRPGRRSRSLAWWLAAAVVIAGTTAAAMRKVMTGAKEPRISGSAYDFASTTWHAVRGLLVGQNVYAIRTQIAGMPANWPAGEHVPATLTWQAPFAALPLWAGFFAFDLATIAAIWAAVVLLTRPRSPQTFLVAVCCGAFAILTTPGVWTLRMGQPAGFELLGIAVVLRARRPWIAAIGVLLTMSTFQTGVPLALALIVLQAWPVVWRGAVLVTALSVPPVVLGVIAAGGVMPYVRVFTLGAFGHLANLPGEPRGLADHPFRNDLGALLERAGIQSTAIQVAAGLLILTLALAFLARLPAGVRRLDYPPVLCVVIAVTILCTYHQPYDMLLVAGAIVPVVLLADDRSVLMAGVLAIAGISVWVPSNFILDPECLLALAGLGAFAARLAARSVNVATSNVTVGTEPTPTGSAA